MKEALVEVAANYTRRIHRDPDTLVWVKVTACPDLSEYLIARSRKLSIKMRMLGKKKGEAGN